MPPSILSRRDPVPGKTTFPIQGWERGCETIYLHPIALSPFSIGAAKPLRH